MTSRILVVVALLMAPHLALAQSTEDSWDNLKQLRAGQKIEVIDMKLKSQKGTFAAYSDEGISLRVRNDDVSIPRGDVFRVTDRGVSHRARNALIGLAVGVAGGLAGGAIAGAAYHEEGEPGVFMLVTVPIGAGIGAGVGAAMPAGHQTIYRAAARRGPSGD